jgi:hypothetical protein
VRRGVSPRRLIDNDTTINPSFLGKKEERYEQ